jgi:hypothetical protein
MEIMIKCKECKYYIGTMCDLYKIAIDMINDEKCEGRQEALTEKICNHESHFIDSMTRCKECEEDDR